MLTINDYKLFTCNALQKASGRNLTSPSPRNTPSYSSLTRCFFSFYQHSEEKLTEQVPKLPFTSLYVSATFVQPIR